MRPEARPPGERVVSMDRVEAGPPAQPPGVPGAQFSNVKHPVLASRGTAGGDDCAAQPEASTPTRTGRATTRAETAGRGARTRASFEGKSGVARGGRSWNGKSGQRHSGLSGFRARKRRVRMRRRGMEAAIHGSEAGP